MELRFATAVAALLFEAAGCGPVVFPAEPDAGTNSPDVTDLVQLVVSKVGDGSGVVVSAPAGIDCGDTCSAEFAVGTEISLAVVAAPDSRFLGWRDSCGNSSSCALVLDADRTITAEFGRAWYDVRVVAAGEGAGHVRVSGSNLVCSGVCSATVAADVRVTFTATAEGASSFVEWRGDCFGAEATCALDVRSALDVVAVFAAPGGLRRFARIVDLGGLPNGGASWAWDVNEGDAATGWARNSSNEQRGFLAREPEPLFDLGTLGGPNSIGWGINDGGWVVGESRDVQGRLRAFSWRGDPAEGPADLGTLGGDDAVAYAINTTGWIVGRAKVGSGAWRAFRRDPRGSMLELGTLGGDYSSARAISDSGWVTGDAALADEHKRAFRAAPEPERRLQELGTLGGLESFGTDINDLGEVVGLARTPAGATHAFFVAAPPSTSLRDLGTLGGQNSYAYGLGADGSIVGMAETSLGIARATLWTAVERTAVDLNELLPRDAGDWELQYATAINRRGSIVGVGLRNGVQHGFLLVP